MRDLRSRGHDVRVFMDGDGYSGSVDDIDVFAGLARHEIHELYEWSDVVLTQLESRTRALKFTALHDRPAVVFLRLGGIEVRADRGHIDLLVYVSDWLRGANPWAGPNMVLHSPIRLEEYRTTPGQSITLIGLSEFKGANTFYALAERFANRLFLGVRGAWGDQIVRRDLDNVEIIDGVADMREVYAKTRLLLMPSRFETLGRVCREAAASGIPTVASSCAGIKEALGPAGIFVTDRDDIDAWALQIEALDDVALYRARGREARRWVEDQAVRFAGELNSFEERIVGIVNDRRVARQSRP